MTSLASLASTLQLDAPLRVGFLGRVSDEEKQDPSLSIPRQYRSVGDKCSELDWQLTRSYWDIESGRNELALRGHGADGSLFNIGVPRDGGLPELLEAARNNEVDVVMVEQIDRLSRITADSTAIERDLANLDIPLFATDEPINLNATTLLTRRVKQAIAEWYVADLLEKSRKGMEESVRQGWHTGGPILYGYIGETHPHPNPHKAADGKAKTKLKVCPICGPVVIQIFVWYCVEGVGLGEIVDRLNSDLDRYPPPKRNKKDENSLRPCWSKATVQSILRNPKYTGFNVWNRHDKRKGRKTLRPQEQWVWSEEMTHDALVSRELFEQVPERARMNEHEQKDGVQRNAPAKRERAGRFYVMRGRCVCDLCNHRMQGSTQKGRPYMRCLWSSGRGAAAVRATGHPGSLQVKEELLVEETIDFLATRVFAPAAILQLRSELEQETQPPADDAALKLDAVRTRAADLATKIERLVAVFEKHDDPEHPVVQATERRIEQLAAEQKSVEAEIRRLEVAVQSAAAAPKPDDLAAILESLPDLRPALATYTDEELAELFSVFDIEARWNHHEKTLKLSATVFPELAEALEEERPLEAAGRSKSFIAGAGFEPATSGL
jgi:site-specific DNA recombinase